jgi:outer membrane protein assembly factor BamB
LRWTFTAATGEVAADARIVSDTQTVVLGDSLVLDAQTGRELFQLPPLPHHFEVTFTATTLGVFDPQSGVLVGYDKQTGAKRWKASGVGLPLSSGTTAVYSGVGSRISALDGTTGRTLWSADVAKRLGPRAYPVASGSGTVIVQTPGFTPTIAALDASDGHVRWTSPTVKVKQLPHVSVTAGRVFVSGDPTTCTD